MLPYTIASLHNHNFHKTTVKFKEKMIYGINFPVGGRFTYRNFFRAAWDSKNTIFIAHLQSHTPKEKATASHSCVFSRYRYKNSPPKRKAVFVSMFAACALMWVGVTKQIPTISAKADPYTKKKTERGLRIEVFNWVFVTKKMPPPTRTSSHSNKRKESERNLRPDSV